MNKEQILTKYPVVSDAYQEFMRRYVLHNSVPIAFAATGLALGYVAVQKIMDHHEVSQDIRNAQQEAEYVTKHPEQYLDAA